MNFKRLDAILAIGCLVLVGTAFADQDRYVRLRYVEGDVALYPADRERPNDATVNTPVMDGDEIQTQSGRAELAFHNGVVVRVADNSSIRVSSTYSPMTIDLLQGTVFVDSHMVKSLGDELMIQAANSQVYLIDEGNMRVDLGQEGAVRVTSNQGQAEVRANGQRILLQQGERTYIDPNTAPETPQAAEKFDDLDDWNASRMDAYAVQNNNGYDENNGNNQGNYVDQSIYYDSYDLNNYGDWQQYGDYGNVWVPQVSYGWRPYCDGRWQYTNGSYFWVGYEPWGWAPYRYGRWGWGANIGWYWVPGNVFGSAWVSWYDYGDYIGWCPLDYWNRPIFGNSHYWNGHYWNGGNYWNSVQKQKTLGPGDSWTFVKKVDLGNVNAKRVSLGSDKVKSIQFDSNKILHSPDSKLVNYVLPSTIKAPGYVNDHRVIKDPGDIKNPVGSKNTDDTFRTRDRDKDTATKTKDKDGDSGTRTKIDKSPGTDNVKHVTVPPNWEKERKPTEIKKTSTVSPYQYDRKGYENGKDHSSQFDRDYQFQRNPAKTYQNVSPYHGSGSPYYRSGNLGDEDRKELIVPDSDGNPYRRGFDSNSNGNPYDSKKEISPRYLDEAKKFFDRFDGNRQGVSRDNQPDNSGSKRANPPTHVDTKRNDNSRTTTTRPPSVSKPSGNDKKPPR